VTDLLKTIKSTGRLVPPTTDVDPATTDAAFPSSTNLACYPSSRQTGSPLSPVTRDASAEFDRKYRPETRAESTSTTFPRSDTSFKRARLQPSVGRSHGTISSLQNDEADLYHRTNASTLRSTLSDGTEDSDVPATNSAAPFEVAEAAAVSTETFGLGLSERHEPARGHSYLDVVEKGIISMDEARNLFDLYDAVSQFF
jgi:hypothetical protein